MKKYTIGRSVIEMLTVLAVIGIITVASISIFQKLYIKRNANVIIHDAQLAYIEKDDSACIQEYVNVDIITDAPVVFESYCDEKNDRYIRISEVTDAVCRELLNRQEKNQLTFYAEDFYSEPTCNQGQNAMILAFNGTPAPAIACETFADCPEGNNWVCDRYSGLCTECEYEVMPNQYRDACIPFECEDPDSETLCAFERERWCCPNTLICDTTNKGCKESTGYCNYYFTEPVVTKTYDCAYKFKEPVVSKQSDCAYELVNDTTRTDVETITLKAVKECKNSNLYCNLRFSDNGCETTAEAGSAVGTVIYGSCSPMAESYAGCNVTVNSANVLELVEPCKNSNLYCNLRYKDEGCATTADASASGLIYGSCSPMAESYAGCNVTVDSSNVLHPGMKCPESQYCYLRYDDEDCTAAPANKTGTIFGVCLAMNSSNAVCPVPKND